MKRNKKHLKMGLMLFFIALITTNCEKDDYLEKEIKNTSSTNHKVKLIDFPEVINFLEKTVPRNKLVLNNTTRPNYDQTKSGNNITILSIEIEDALQNIDENEKSNFSLKANAQNNTEEFKLVSYNYIISEYGTEYYSFIIEKEYDLDWFKTQNPTKIDQEKFTGTLRLYNYYGNFVEKYKFIDGTITSIIRSSDPCCDNCGADSDDVGDDNGSGGGPTIVIICGCSPGHSGGNSNPNCTCTLDNEITIYLNRPNTDIVDDPILSPSPCGDGGGSDGSNDNNDGNVLPPLPEQCFYLGDPVDCENPNIPMSDEELLDNFFSMIILLNQNYVNTHPNSNENFYVLYANQINWLMLYKEVTTELLNFLISNNYSAESYADVLSAIEILMVNENLTFQEVPTQRMNNLLTNSNFKDALTYLKTSVQNGEDDEEGYEVSIVDSNISPHWVAGGYELKLKVGGNIRGHMHFHTDVGYQMFSGEDISQLYRLFAKGRESNSELTSQEVFSVVVTNLGTFAISINHFTAFRHIMNIKKRRDKLFKGLNRRYYKLSRNNFSSSLDYLAVLLIEINSFTPNNINPINVFKLNLTGTEFEQVELNENNEAVIIPND